MFSPLFPVPADLVTCSRQTPEGAPPDSLSQQARPHPRAHSKASKDWERTDVSKHLVV